MNANKGWKVLKNFYYYIYNNIIYIVVTFSSHIFYCS